MPYDRFLWVCNIWASRFAWWLAVIRDKWSRLLTWPDKVQMFVSSLHLRFGTASAVFCLYMVLTVGSTIFRQHCLRTYYYASNVFPCVKLKNPKSWINSSLQNTNLIQIVHPVLLFQIYCKFNFLYIYTLWGRNVGCGYLRTGCWEEYLGLRGTR